MITNDQLWAYMTDDGDLPATLWLDGDGRIARDMLCRQCAYNLRGIDPAGWCPECGTAAVWSLGGDRLRYADPRWVERLLRGVALLQIGLPASLVTYIAFGGLGFTHTGPGGFIVVAAAVVALLVIAGIWMLTSRESTNTDTRQLNSRTIARYTLTAAVLTLFVCVVLALRRENMPLALLLQLSANLIAIAGLVALTLHLRELARRMDAASIARLIPGTIFGLPLFGLVLVIGLYASVGFGLSFYLASSCAVGTALLGGLFGTLIVLFEFKARLRQCVKAACQHTARLADAGIHPPSTRRRNPSRR